MTPEQIAMVRELRHEGYAIVIWTPDEVGTANPRRVEDQQVEMGWDVIFDLQGEPCD